MQLRVLLDAPRVRTTDDFLIRDLPGTSRRLDVVCRVLIATYHTVPELAPYIQFNAILGGPPNPPLQLHIKDTSAEHVPEGELACAVIVKTLLFLLRTKGEGHSSHWPEFTLRPKSFEDTLKELVHPSAQCMYFVEDGKPLNQVDFNPNSPLSLILGDNQGLSPEHEALVLQYPVQKVSLGTRSLLGSHVVSLFLLELAHRKERRHASQ